MWPKNGISVMLARRAAGIGAVVAGVVAMAGAVRGEDKIQMKPLRVGASLSFGQMFNVEDSIQDVPRFNPTVTLPYTSLWIFQDAVVNERLNFSLAIAGTFWYPYPEDNKVGWTSYRTGGVAIAQAMGAYSIGDVEKPWLKVSVGQQGYKYNPHAKNFGEYLFRSEAYPTTVRTGDWGAIDNAGAGIWGVAFKGRFLNGLLNNDILVTLANERSPLHDISLTNITSLNIGNVLQIGGGVSFSRLIQFDTEKSRPEAANTGWFTWSAGDQLALNTYIQRMRSINPDTLTAHPNFQRDMLQRTPDGLRDTMVTVRDTALEVGQTYWAGSQRPLVKQLAESLDPRDTLASQTGVSKFGEIEYIDTKSIILMGRISLDPKPLMGLQGALGPMDLTLYSEVSIIGLKNYPIYYLKTEDRMPIMVGLYLPTFGLLDWVTVEAEYFKNPHINSDYISAYFRTPQPKSPNGTQSEIPAIADPVYDDQRTPLNPNPSDKFDVKHTADDLKWTFTAQKSFGVWSLAGQVGKDHFRPLTGAFRPSYTEAMTTSDAWYYMIRMMVNL